MVRITFDDGNASDVEVALSDLWSAASMRSSSCFPGCWESATGRPRRCPRVAGHRHGDRVARAGRIGTGGGSTERRRGEKLDDAHRVLGKLTGHPVSHVAIPFGSYDRHVLRRLRAAGVTRAYTSDGGRARPDQPAARLGRRLDRPGTRPQPRPWLGARGGAARSQAPMRMILFGGASSCMTRSHAKQLSWQTKALPASARVGSFNRNFDHDGRSN
jgi:hypothetical protein